MVMRRMNKNYVFLMSALCCFIFLYSMDSPTLRSKKAISSVVFDIAAIWYSQALNKHDGKQMERILEQFDMHDQHEILNRVCQMQLQQEAKVAQCLQQKKQSDARDKANNLESIFDQYFDGALDGHAHVSYGSDSFLQTHA